jgi:alkyldihydroxyacetonephosphate synthase
VTEPIDHTLRGRWASDDAALPPGALRWLQGRIGAVEQTGGRPAPDRRDLSPSTLSEPALTALGSIVGERHVLVEDPARLGRTGGLSYLDLLRRRLDEPLDLPDAVVTPADPGQVQAVLEVCRKHDVAVVPFGGGTSVVGGVSALRGDKAAVVALDLVRLDRLVEVDPVSRLAVLQAGVRGPAAERLLAGYGLTLGHLPQSFERATIGGFVATRSAGQASSGYGRFEDMVQGLRIATPAGEWRLGGAPASAAGPDLRRLVCGSEGAFGVVTEATLRVRPAPTERHYVGLVLDGWQRGIDAVRALAQRPALADVTRLSDVEETDAGLALVGGVRTAVLRRYLRARSVSAPCLLVLGWEDTSARALAARRAGTMRVLRRFDPVSLGAAAGRAWLRSRFAGPRQRDALMAAGVCVETLETATRWSALPALADTVRAALTEALTDASTRPLVLCHISHAYETGASLYFTVLVPRSAEDPIGQWQRAKHAASEAIVAAGGTISHHHAVGTDHRPWLATEIGELGVDVLRAVKQACDPTGILNPGKLV